MARTAAHMTDVATAHGLAQMVAQVRAERAVSLRALGLHRLERAEEGELLAALGRAGLEHTGRAIRVPLSEQVQDIAQRAGAAGVAEAALAEQVKGARSAAEIRLACRELIEEGRLALVVDGSGTKLSAPGEYLLRAHELDQLAAWTKQLASLVRATGLARDRPRATVARHHLAEALSRLSTLAGQNDTSAWWSDANARRDDMNVKQDDTRAQRDATGAARVAVQAAFRVAPARAGLIHVPEVIRALEPLYERDALVAAALQLAQEGALELRPDASLTRMADEDRARCPLAPDGTPLSHARPLGGAQGVQP